MASGKIAPPRKRAAGASKTAKDISSKEPVQRKRFTSADLSDLIKGIDPELLADFLKGEERLGAKLLRGFRVVPRTVKMPVVQQRILQEAEANPSLQEILEMLWVDSNKSLWARIELSKARDIAEALGDIVGEYGVEATRAALLLDDRRTVNRLVGQIERHLFGPKQEKETAQPPRVVENKTLPEASLREENKRLRQRIRELDDKRRKLERTLEQRSHQVKHDQAEYKDLQRQKSNSDRELAKAEKTIDRLRRGKEAATNERSRLERRLQAAYAQIEALKQQLEALKPPAEPAVRGQSPNWLLVVCIMLKNGEYQAAKIFSETLRDLEPDNPYAHRVLAHIYAKLGMIERQREECLWVADYLNRRCQPTRACAFALRALEAEPECEAVKKRTKECLTKIRLSDESSVSAVRALFARLRSHNVEAHRVACRVVKQLGREYCCLLDVQPSVLHADRIISLSAGGRSVSVTVRRIMEAVDTNDVELVNFLRVAIANLKRTDSQAYKTLMESLGSQDRSCVTAIIKGGEPVIVDGSNVAWHDIRTKPRLQNILDLRSELRSEGFFPIYVYVDAALPYQVDQQSALRQLIDTGAVLVVDSHTDADEEITRRARDLACPIVTNDRMHDWDPAGEIPKLRFAIDRFGVTIYDG